LRYKIRLESMVLRRSSSVVFAALLAGCGGAAFFAPAVRAGEPIEFSAPAIPLSVPKPDKEIKEPDRMNIPPGMAAEYMGSAAMSPDMPMVIVPPKAKAREAWGSGASGNERRDDPYDDIWHRDSSEQSLLTNDFRMRQAWDSSAASRQSQRRAGYPLDISQDTRLFGVQNDLNRVGARGENRLGRGFSDDSDSAIWSMALNRHDPSMLDRLRDGRFSPFIDDTPRAAMGIAGTGLPINTGSAGSPPSSSLVPPDFGSSSFLDDSTRRQTGESADGGPQEQMRAWGSQPATRQLPKSNPGREQPGPKRVVAPNRPATLPWAKKPGDL
jgi:hypothetical protein